MDDQEISCCKRSEKEVHGVGKDKEKIKRKFKLMKDDVEAFKHKRERRERKEKRKREKEKRRKKLEKLDKTKPEKIQTISPRGSVEGSTCSRLSGEEEHQKNMTISSNTREMKPGNEASESVFNTEKYRKRELSPELARISALTEGPPKISKCDCMKTSLFRTKCTNSSCSSSDSLENICSTSRSNPPHLERVDISTPAYRKTSNPPPLEREDVSKLRAALKMYCDERRPQKDIDLGPPVLEPLDPVAYYYDSDGNKVWLCPTCGGQDDGSPMIGCDGCDAWYHWVCVGMQTAPEENEDWYCRHCVAKHRERIRMKQKFPKKKPCP